MKNRKKIKIFDIDIDQLTMLEAVKAISEWVNDDDSKGHYVVTPNVDHIVNLTKNKSFKEAYDNASLVVADGHPVVLASKLLGKKLPEVIPGSDLVPSLFDYYQTTLNKPLKVFILGAMPGVAGRAAEKIQTKWPNVNIVGCYSPEFGFEVSVQKGLEICEIINQSNSDIVVFGVGAPKQELWCHQYSKQLNVKAILCVGATIDFLAGEKSRAPIWMRKTGLEWLHRVLSEPKRLTKRYIVDAFIFPLIVWREWNK